MEEGCYIAFVEELPGANTQGATLEETRQNLTEAISLLLGCYREELEQGLVGQTITREPISVP